MAEEHTEHGLTDQGSVESSVIDVGSFARRDVEIIAAGRWRHDPLELRRVAKPFLLKVPYNRDLCSCQALMKLDLGLGARDIDAG